MYIQEVIAYRHLDKTDLRLLENITLCLDALRMIQVVQNRIDFLKSQSFDLSEHGEHYLLLDILWINLTVITDNVCTYTMYVCVYICVFMYRYYLYACV